MNEHYLANDDILRSLDGARLFYPCSGNDLDVPIRIFSPYVTDFWFVDRGYFSPGNQDTQAYGLDVPADKRLPLLQQNPAYRFKRRSINGLANWEHRSWDIEPCILTEVYEHLATGRTIQINLRRGYGFSALRQEPALARIGVFFYRGDSLGEGGSGNLWLLPEHLHEVLGHMTNGGLIVTDGSNIGRSNREYRKLAEFKSYRYPQYSGNTGDVLSFARDLVARAQPFMDSAGRNFICVGYAGERYGPTLMWAVQR